MEGKDIVAAFKAWLKSEDGKTCMSGEAKGHYLRNRLEVAFQAGIEAAEAPAENSEK